MPAYGPQTVALDVDPHFFNLATPLEAANTIQGGQLENQQRQSELALAPLKQQQLQSELDQSGIRTQAMRSALPVQQAQDTASVSALQKKQVADALSTIDWRSPTASQDSDAAMSKLRDSGNPFASQIAGHLLNPDKASSIIGAYTAASPLEAATAIGGGADPLTAEARQALDVQFNGATSEQLAKAAQRQAMFHSAIRDVATSANPAAAWDDYAQKFNLPGLKGQYSPTNVAALDKQMRIADEYLQQRIQAQQAGMPNPIVPKEIKTVGDVAYSVDPRTGAMTPLTQRPGKYQLGQGTDASGHPIVLDTTTGQITSGGASTPGVSPGIADFVTRLLPTENSTGNPAAKNPNSSAAGNGQFIDKTWLSTIKANRPDLAQGKTDSEILALRSDPNLSREMTTDLAMQNSDGLQMAGYSVNGATLAMAHKLGLDGAESVLASDQSLPLTKVLPSAVIAANPQLRRLTVGQYTQGLINQFGASQIDTNPGDPNATGEDFMKTLPKGRANLIRAVANGDAAMPTGRALTSPAGQQLMQQVLQFDPTASAVNLPTRQATRKAFTQGTQGQSIVQANTVGGHLAALDALSGNLHNTGIPMWNAAAQAVGTAIGNPSTQKAVTDFSTLSNTLAEELTKFYRNSGGTLEEVKQFRSQLAPSNSPVQIHAAIQQMAAAVLSKIGALNDSYNVGMSKVSGGLNLPNINHNAIAQLQRLAGPEAISFGDETQAPPGAQVVVNPQTGAKMAYDSATRAWKPL